MCAFSSHSQPSCPGRELRDDKGVRVGEVQQDDGGDDGFPRTSRSVLCGLEPEVGAEVGGDLVDIVLELLVGPLFA